MTVINVSAMETVLAGLGPLPAGYINVQRWTEGSDGGYAPVLVNGEAVVFPTSIDVPVVNGSPDTVTLDPTNGQFCYRWQFGNTETGHNLTVYTSVPGSGTYDFGDLTIVDPATYQPSDDAVAAWEAALEDVEAILTQVSNLATQAEGSAFDAAGSATASGTSATNAASSATAAALSATAAADSASEAENAADSAQTSAGEASASASAADNSAGTAASAASASAGSAVDAAGSASSATASAGSAASDAVAAADSASGASGSAVAAANAAGAAATSAIAAGTAADRAELAAEEAVVGGSDLGDKAGAFTLTQEQTQHSYLEMRLTDDASVTVTAGVPDEVYSCTLQITQDGTGGRMIALLNVATPEGAPIPLSAGANKQDIIRLEWNGARWAAYLGGPNMSIPTSWVV